MDSRKLERIVIIILLLLNVFLLAVVLSDGVQDRRARRETVEAVTAMLLENGITVGQEAELLQTAPTACTLVRSTQTEQEKLQALIGQSQREDLGGNILYYRSETGQASLRGSGETDILLSGGGVALRGGPEKTALRVLNRLGIEAQVRSVSADSVEAYCCWNGCPVYNAVLSVTYSSKGVYMINGTRIFDTQTEQSDEDLLDSVSVLLRFVELVKEEGRICSRIDRLTPGYLMDVTVSGEGSMIPVWCIETDTGTLVINAHTGLTESVSA